MISAALFSAYFPFAVISFFASVFGAIIVASIDSSRFEVEPEADDGPLPDPNLN